METTWCGCWHFMKKNNEVVKNKRKKGWLIFLNILLVILVFFLILRIIVFINYSGFYIVGSSMSPTLTGATSENSKGGDYLYVSKNQTATYGNIVVANAVDPVTQSEKVIIKRVIACAGDSVYLLEGTVYIKYAGTETFEPLTETYVAAENNYYSNYPYLDSKEQVVDTNGITVPENCYFLLGDNRDNSRDSREYGCFTSEAIVGVVADWSLTLKGAISWWHNAFSFKS
jgi:signal peptidase I